MFIKHTTPYPWPFEGDFGSRPSIVVICGAGPIWSSRSPRWPLAEYNISRLRRAAVEQKIPVVLLHHDDLNTNHASQPHDSCSNPLYPLPGEQIVTAAGIDGFYGSKLETILNRNRCRHILLAGRGFETTVHSTLRSANDRGYECLAIADACTVLEPQLAASSVSTIEMSGGIFGAVGFVNNVLATWAQTTPKNS